MITTQTQQSYLKMTEAMKKFKEKCFRDQKEQWQLTEGTFFNTNCTKMNKNNITIVTGLWDIKRDNLSKGWKRSFEHYLQNFKRFLDLPYNLIIFGEKNLEEVVFNKRAKSNTQFIVREQDWFIKNEFYENIQKIRQSNKWKKQVSWLGESPQARLEMYNPLVMSKVFLLHDAQILDKFDSTYMYWLDAGITNTVHPDYFTHDKVIDKLGNIDKISFIAFPYKGKIEIHGFEYSHLCQLASAKVDKVCRGGFFGGPKKELSKFNTQYYHLMNSTLKDGYMGREESLFTILTYRHPENYQYFEIESNGLINKFFEDVKNNKHKAKSVHSKPKPDPNQKTKIY